MGCVSSQFVNRSVPLLERYRSVSLFLVTAPPNERRAGRGRPRRPEADTAIVAATLELLAEHGFQATTMDAIAARASVAKNTIYRRWASKEQLLAVALDELVGPQVEVDENAGIDQFLREHSRDIARTLADPLVRRILPDLVGELHRNRAFAVAFADRLVQPRRAVLVNRLRRAVERGELRREVDVELVADLLVGPPFARVLLPLGVPELTADGADGLVATILHGLTDG
jgi:AcrR family transcriptional regulator